MSVNKFNLESMFRRAKGIGWITDHHNKLHTIAMSDVSKKTFDLAKDCIFIRTARPDLGNYFRACQNGC